MKQKTAAFLLLSLTLCASDALGGQDRSKSEASHKMPVYGADARHTPGYEQAKKAIEVATKGRSLKEIFNHFRAQVEVFSQKGDPKTTYHQRANRLHAKFKHAKIRHAKTKHNRSKQAILQLSDPASATTYVNPTDGTVQVNYQYEELTAATPYDKVIVVYDPVTGVAIKATGYTTTYLADTPDLSGMTLKNTGLRSDGSLAYETYQTEPDATGGYKQTVLWYDSTTIPNPIVQTVVQPLDLKKVKLPPLA